LLKDITKERNGVSHPSLSKKDYQELNDKFLEYCNENLSSDIKTNESLTTEIFKSLLS
jgi:hypothetical protein